MKLPRADQSLEISVDVWTGLQYFDRRRQSKKLSFVNLLVIASISLDATASHWGHIMLIKDYSTFPKERKIKNNFFFLQSISIDIFFFFRTVQKTFFLAIFSLVHF
jgi:hypothetical protein